jgi:hypothetical protein
VSLVDCETFVITMGLAAAAAADYAVMVSRCILFGIL